MAFYTRVWCVFSFLSLRMDDKAKSRERQQSCSAVTRSQIILLASGGKIMETLSSFSRGDALCHSSRKTKSCFFYLRRKSEIRYADWDLCKTVLGAFFY